MSSIASNAEDLILNADGGSSTVKIKINGTEKASISSAGAFTSTTIDATALTGDLPAISGAALTGVGVAGITSTADATAITIDSSENVGIGTTSPTENLHIKEARSAGAGMVPLIKVQTTNNNTTGDGSAIAFHGDYNSTEWGFGKIGGANSGANYGGALEFHTNAGNGSSASVAYTKQLTIMHDGRGLSQFTAKAWVNFNGSGTIAIRDSHNISSIQDGGVGDYDVFFDVDMANVNYCWVYGGGDTGGAETTFQGGGTAAVGSHTVRLKNAAGTVTDRPYINGLYFGD